MNRLTPERFAVKKWGRIFAAGILILAILGFTFSSLFWIINVNVMLEEISFLRDFFAWEGKNNFTENTYFRYIKSLCKDLSSITPFLLAWFFFGLCRGSFRILQQGIPTANWHNWLHFPFPRNHKTHWVQLGLLGTIWGFLIIGFQMEENKENTQEAINILIQAFGTALLSTFTAVILAYICAPLAIQGIRKFLDNTVMQQNELPWRKTTVSAIDQVSSSLIAFGKKVKSASEEIDGFVNALGTIKEQIQTLPDVVNQISNIQKNISSINTKLEGFPNNLQNSIETGSTAIQNSISQALSQSNNYHQENKNQFSQMASKLQHNIEKQKEIQSILKKDIGSKLQNNFDAQLQTQSILKDDVIPSLIQTKSNISKEQKITREIFKEEFSESRKYQEDQFVNMKESLSFLRNLRVKLYENREKDSSISIIPKQLLSFFKKKKNVEIDIKEENLR